MSKMRRCRPVRRALEQLAPRCLDKLSGAATVIMAGTPLFYFIGERSFLEIEREYGEDWPNRVFKQRIDSNREGQFLCLGLGSVYEGDPEHLFARNPAVAEFIARFIERAQLITTRDHATDLLLRAVPGGSSARVIRSVCPSLWARQWFGVSCPAEPRTVLLGFSVESAGWDLSLPKAAVLEARRRAVEWTIAYFKSRQYDIRLIAHNALDAGVQRELAREANLAAPLMADARELLSQSSRCSISVTWRVHGALAALSSGRPTLLFRTDSRWQTADGMGAIILDDRLLSREELIQALEQLCARCSGVQEHLVDTTAELTRLRPALLEALTRQGRRA
jgi:hypothetical protein